MLSTTNGHVIWLQTIRWEKVSADADHIQEWVRSGFGIVLFDLWISRPLKICLCRSYFIIKILEFPFHSSLMEQCMQLHFWFEVCVCLSVRIVYEELMTGKLCNQGFLWTHRRSKITKRQAFFLTKTTSTKTVVFDFKTQSELLDQFWLCSTAEMTQFPFPQS